LATIFFIPVDFGKKYDKIPLPGVSYERISKAIVGWLTKGIEDTGKLARGR
jgi:hypothetical protein